VLKLLLDEHISHEVVVGLRRRRGSIVVQCMSEWEKGKFLGLDDSVFLAEAAAQQLTLVTYDRRTIPLLLKMWAEEGRRHGGVVFIDEKSVPPNEIGSLVRAMLSLFEETSDWNWTDRVCFLRR
jgi:hypothetical protein